MNNLYFRFFIYLLFAITFGVGVISIVLIKKENVEKTTIETQLNQKDLFILSDLSENLIEETDTAILEAEKKHSDGFVYYDKDGVLEKSFEEVVVDDRQKFNEDTEDMIRELSIEEPVFSDELPLLSVPVVSTLKKNEDHVMKRREKVFTTVSYNYERSSSLLEGMEQSGVSPTESVNVFYNFPALLAGTKVPIIIDDFEYSLPASRSMKATIMRNIYAFNASNVVIFPGGAIVNLKVLAMSENNSIRLCTDKIITLFHIYILKECAIVYDNDFSDSIPLSSNFLSSVMDVLSDLLTITLNQLTMTTKETFSPLNSEESEEVRKYASGLSAPDNTEASVQSFSDSIAMKVISILNSRSEGFNVIDNKFRKELQISLSKGLKKIIDQHFWKTIKHAVRGKVDTSRILYFVLEEDIVLKM